MTIKVWLLPYEFLDEHRLLAQHKDLHDLRTQITGSVMTSQAAFRYARSLHFLAGMHDMCVVELEMPRNVKGLPVKKKKPHSSPFLFGSAEMRWATVDPSPQRAELIQDVQDLRAAWIAEGYYHGMGRSDLRQAEQSLGLPMGHDPYNVHYIREEMKKFLKQNRALSGHSPAERLNYYRQMNGPFAWQNPDPVELKTAEESLRLVRP